MANEKLIAGAVMILLNLVLLSPIATSMVEDAVEDNFETYPYDSACADSDCTTAEEDWASSTSDRSYYAWNLTNADAVMAGGDPVYEKLGRLTTRLQPLETSLSSTSLQVHSPTTNQSHSLAQWTILRIATHQSHNSTFHSNLKLLVQLDWLLKVSWI